MFIIVEKPFNDEDIYAVFIKELKISTGDEIRRYIEFLDVKFPLQKIYMDTTGGFGTVYDELMTKPALSYKLVSCNFASSLDGRPFKEVMFSNLKALMEKRVKNLPGGLHIPNHRKLIYELIDLRYEPADSGKLKIHHSERGHDDFADALGLACLLFRQHEGSSYEPTWYVA